MASMFKQSLSLPRLPPELADMVIDNLEWDIHSLCQTCLVCRSWLPRSRVHLFKRLAVSISRRKDFDAAVAFLTKKHHITRHIQSLQLKGPPIQYDDDTPLAAQEQPPSIPASVLATLLAILPRLRDLHLTDISFWSYNLRPTKLQSTSRFKLDMLTMHGVGSMRDTTDHVMSVLSLFSEIKSLSLASVVQRLDPRTCVPEGLGIHALHVGDVPNVVYFEAARAMKLRGSLASVTAQIYCLEDVTSFAGLIEDTAPELLSLGVDVVRLFTTYEDVDDAEPWRTDPDEVLRDIIPKIALCKKLKWLSVMVPYEGYAQEQSYSFDAWNFLMGMLSFVPPSVVHLSIIFISNDGASIKTVDYDWTQLYVKLQAYATRDDKLFRLICVGLESDEEGSAFAILNALGPILP